MYRYKRLLVGIPYGTKKSTVIRFAEKISRLADTEKIVFLYLDSKCEEIPDDLLRDYPELAPTCDFSVRLELEELVEKNFRRNSSIRLEFDAIEGHPLIDLLRRAKEDETDLILMHRTGESSEGSFFTKLARKAPCSVLLVPEAIDPDFKHILVPIDFSEHASDAMEVSIAFALASDTKEINCLHIYDVPLGYYKTGKSYEEFAEIMKGHAENAFAQFVKSLDMKGIKPIPLFRLQGKKHKGIEEEILDHDDFDLIVIGSRGRKAAAGVLLGSVTEHLIKECSIPLLAVKRKGENMGFLEALLKL